MKLSAVIDGFWLDRRRELSKTTVTNYSRFFKYLIAFTGDAEFGEITTRDIRRFLEHLLLDRNYSKRSVHDAWIPLSSLWTWAEIELGTPHIIRGKIAVPSFPESIIEPFTKGEIRALLIAAEYSTPWKSRKGKPAKSLRPTADRDKAILLVLLDTGIRASELCNLMLYDYDDQRGRLHIQHGKGDKPRAVYLGDRARKAIWRYLAERRTKATSPLFATKTGSPIERNNLRRTLQAIADLAGVQDLTVHKFRHTFAITFLRNGGNVAELQRILGHTTIQMSLHYARLAEVDIEAAGKSYSPADNWKL
ncbi:MAG: tyrosine-type recombinase/integrase [Caldilineaceae bacterium]|nr:tyrosine-type recombinase/integrase [Caldilineaceae bacterium]